MNDEICQKDGCCQWFGKRMGGNTADFMNSCLDDHTAYLWGLIQVEKKRKTLQHLPSNIGSSCWTLLIYSWSIFQASWWHGQATWLSFPSSKMVTSPFSYIQPTRIPTVGGAPQLNIFHRLKHHQKRSPWGTEVCRCINPSKPFKPLFMVFA